MKTLSTVAMYGLVPVPPMHDAQAFGDNDDQPPTTDDANAALLAWYRHWQRKIRLCATGSHLRTWAPGCGPTTTKHVETTLPGELVRFDS